MKRYLLGCAIGAIIIFVYHQQNRPVFNYDFLSQVRCALFTINPDTSRTEGIVILNSVGLGIDEIVREIDSLVLLKPRRIGINYCHDFEGNIALQQHFRRNEKIVFCRCGDGVGQSSALIQDGNRVQYFRTDSDAYFESRLTTQWQEVRRRDHGRELISFHDASSGFMAGPLGLKFDSVFIQNTVFLIGDIGEYGMYLNTSGIPASYPYGRITPVTLDFGDEDGQPNMPDIIISANIISTIENDNYFYEVPQGVRAGVIFFFLFVNITLIIYCMSRWVWLNVILAAIYFFMLTVSGGALIVWLFTKKIYLALDELPMVLLIATLTIFVLDIFIRKTAVAEASEVV